MTEISLLTNGSHWLCKVSDLSLFSKVRLLQIWTVFRIIIAGFLTGSIVLLCTLLNHLATQSWVILYDFVKAFLVFSAWISLRRKFIVNFFLMIMKIGFWGFHLVYCLDLSRWCSLSKRSKIASHPKAAIFITLLLWWTFAHIDKFSLSKLTLYCTSLSYKFSMTMVKSILDHSTIFLLVLCYLEITIHSSLLEITFVNGSAIKEYLGSSPMHWIIQNLANINWALKKIQQAFSNLPFFQTYTKIDTVSVLLNVWLRDRII